MYVPRPFGLDWRGWLDSSVIDYSTDVAHAIYHLLAWANHDASFRDECDTQDGGE